MNNNIWTALTALFSGRGATLKFAIAASLFAGLAYEVMESNYNLTMTASDASINLSPSARQADAEIEGQTEVVPSADDYLPEEQQA